MFKQVSARIAAQQQASLFEGDAADFQLVAQDKKGQDVAPEKAFEVDGERFSLVSMLEANGDDKALCEWLQACAVGDQFPAFVECVRVA